MGLLMQGLEGALHMALKTCDERVSFHIRSVFIDLNLALVMPIVIVSDRAGPLVSIVYDQNLEIDVSHHVLASASLTRRAFKFTYRTMIEAFFNLEIPFDYLDFGKFCQDNAVFVRGTF
jgi:hypothetical protein